jgi:hypothetical protein
MPIVSPHTTTTPSRRTTPRPSPRSTTAHNPHLLTQSGGQHGWDHRREFWAITWGQAPSSITFPRFETKAEAEDWWTSSAEAADIRERVDAMQQAAYDDHVYDLADDYPEEY